MTVASRAPQALIFMSIALRYFTLIAQSRKDGTVSLALGKIVEDAVTAAVAAADEPCDGISTEALVAAVTVNMITEAADATGLAATDPTYQVLMEHLSSLVE